MSPVTPAHPQPPSLLPPTRTLLLRRGVALISSLAVGAALAAAALPPVELPDAEEEERAWAVAAAAAATSGEGGPKPLPLSTRLAASLDGATDRVARAGRAGGTLWRAAAAEGWGPRRAVGAVRRRGGGEGDGTAARGLAAVAEWAAASADTRRALADVGGARLGKWLLAAAGASPPGSPDREAAEVALAALLWDGKTAACALRAPGARGALLRLAATSAHPALLADALADAVSAATPTPQAAAAAAVGLRPPGGGAGGGGSGGARLADVRVAVQLLSAPTHPDGAAPSVPAVLQEAALALLAAWAEAGPLEAGKVAAMGGGAALAAAAARLVGEGGGGSTSSPSPPGDARKARAALVRAMHALADALPSPPDGTAGSGGGGGGGGRRRKGLRSPLAPAGWVDPLAYLLADALAEGDEVGAAAALDALAAALDAGAGLGAGADATAGTLGPLLATAASSPTSAPEVRASACRALAAAARSPSARPALGEALMDEVTEYFIGRLVSGAPGRVAAAAKAAADAAKAADAVFLKPLPSADPAQPPAGGGGGGWKRPALPKKKAPPAAPPPPGPGEAAAVVAALAALCGEPRGGGRGGGGSTTKAIGPLPDAAAPSAARGRERAAAWLGDLLVAASMDATPMGAAAAAAAKAKAAGAAAAAAAGAAPGSEHDAAAPAGWAAWLPGWARGVWRQPPPPQAGATPLADLAGDDAGTDASEPAAAAAAEAALGGDGRAGRGVAAAATAAAAAAAAASPSPPPPAQPTTSSSAHYATAVAVGPAWARGVAADLRDRFGRAAASFAEPPGDGLDALLGPAAAAAYPAAAAAVDAALADAALADALAALAELAGPEPAKVGWLASAGVVPLLARLVVDRDPPPPVAPAAAPPGDGGEGDGEDQPVLALPPPPAAGPPEERPALPARRAAARLLAMVARTPAGAAALAADRATLAWLAVAAGEADCTLASHAARAGLALEGRPRGLMRKRARPPRCGWLGRARQAALPHPPSHPAARRLTSWTASTFFNRARATTSPWRVAWVSSAGGTTTHPSLSLTHPRPSCRRLPRPSCPRSSMSSSFTAYGAGPLRPGGWARCWRRRRKERRTQQSRPPKKGTPPPPPSAARPSGTARARPAAAGARPSRPPSNRAPAWPRPPSGRPPGWPRTRGRARGCCLWITPRLPLGGRASPCPWPARSPAWPTAWSRRAWAAALSSSSAIPWAGWSSKSCSPPAWRRRVPTQRPPTPPWAGPPRAPSSTPARTGVPGWRAWGGTCAS